MHLSYQPDLGFSGCVPPVGEVGMKPGGCLHMASSLYGPWPEGGPYPHAPGGGQSGWLGSSLGSALRTGAGGGGGIIKPPGSLP